MSQRMMVVRPLREESDQARQLGFRMRLLHDPKERIMRVRLDAETPRARQAVKVAAESSQITGIEAGVTYSPLDDVWDVAYACARTALERAREVL